MRTEPTPFAWTIPNDWGLRYWRTGNVGAVFISPASSEAFLVLKAEQTGVMLALVPLVGCHEWRLCTVGLPIWAIV